MVPAPRSPEGVDAAAPAQRGVRHGGAVVEILGPAGAGKTTLARLLSEEYPCVRVGLGVRKPLSFLRLVVGSGPLLPLWLRRYRADRWFTWRELRSIAFVESWLRAVGRTAPGTLTVLDHGPVFRLARFLASGPSIVESERFRRWWHRYLDGWLEALDLLVLLDAPDSVLLERVSQRGHWFLAGDRPEGEKRRFLAVYRECFERTLASATVTPRILRLRSDRATPSDLAAAVYREVDLGDRP